MDVVEMVLSGRVNKGLVTMIQQEGGKAVGLCGKDTGIIKARQMVEAEIGFVGDIISIQPDLLKTLAANGYLPVVASVAADANGQALNVNADIAAGEVGFLPQCMPSRARPKSPASTHGASASIDLSFRAAQIAAAMQAERLILMTDVPGVLRDKDDINTKYTSLDISETRHLVSSGIIAGGMIPKYAKRCSTPDCCTQPACFLLRLRITRPRTWKSWTTLCASFL